MSESLSDVYSESLFSDDSSNSSATEDVELSSSNESSLYSSFSSSEMSSVYNLRPPIDRNPEFFSADTLGEKSSTIPLLNSQSIPSSEPPSFSNDDESKTGVDWGICSCEMPKLLVFLSCSEGKPKPL
ncbi:hypothetical protein V8G54_013921 [Vigna mungo]|uniref:Uncharacterized protein n=1 Tax=Vigna mungo TaxID=3915 RepID=A0AAQ3RYT8_VIGMU